MNWRRIGISLAVYTLGSSFACAVVLMLPSEKRPGDLVLPFMVFMPAAVNELRGRRGQGQLSKVGTQLVGALGILLFSLTAYVGHYFCPERVISPHNSFLGSLLALVSVYPVLWTLERVKPRPKLSE